MATVRRVPAAEHHFQLVITRVYEEGDQELLQDEDESAFTLFFVSLFFASPFPRPGPLTTEFMHSGRRAPVPDQRGACVPRRRTRRRPDLHVERHQRRRGRVLRVRGRRHERAHARLLRDVHVPRDVRAQVPPQRREHRRRGPRAVYLQVRFNFCPLCPCGSGGY